MNPLKKLQDFGQSVYLDEISRSLIDSGELDTLIERDGLRGITSNPAIFEKAIADTSDYDDIIAWLAKEDKDVLELFETIAIKDVQDAADHFRSTFDASDGRYGFVSLEVSPKLAHDTEATINEARRLWASLNRPNVFIKVPGNDAGIPAIEQLIAEGINVNITLLFGLPRHRQVMEAYLSGLEQRANKGEPLKHVASVASFFLSRIDVKVDKMLDGIIEQGGDKADLAQSLRGEVAIANAKQAYQEFKEIFSGERFKTLAEKGARTQRVLWASTSTKDPSYSDVMYVEPLIGPETINTLPSNTMDAYRDHGEPAARIEDELEHAQNVLAQLETVGIDLNQVTKELEVEGIEKFVKPFDSLMATLKDAVSKTPA